MLCFVERKMLMNFCNYSTVLGISRGLYTYNIWLIFTTLSDIIRKKTSVLLTRKQHVSKSDTEVKQDANGRGGDDPVLS